MSGNARVDIGELLCRTSGGDRAAFRALYEEAGGQLFAICLRMVRDRNEAEDVLQEAFVKIWQKSYMFDPARGEGIAWLATIARNSALDRLRRPGRADQPYDELAVAELDTHFDSYDTATAADLRNCLQSLRSEYHKAIVLAYMNGMTHEELAKALGHPLGTIKSWLRRGLEQLKGCMDQ